MLDKLLARGPRPHPLPCGPDCDTPLVGELADPSLDAQIIPITRERLLEGAGRVRDIARNSKGEVFVAIEGAGTVVHLEPMEMK